MSDLSPETFARLREIVKDALKFRDLSEFERAFVMDYAGRFDRFGRAAYVSDKQHLVFDRIEAKIYDVG